LAGDGVVDLQRRQILGDCASGLSAVPPAVTEGDAKYLARLVQIAEPARDPS